jgi:hypothetical protein
MSYCSLTLKEILRDPAAGGARDDAMSAMWYEGYGRSYGEGCDQGGFVEPDVCEEDKVRLLGN